MFREMKLNKRKFNKIVIDCLKIHITNAGRQGF